MSNQQQQQTKVALVTGGSSGIGEATVLQYANLGYRVAFTGRNVDRLKGVSEKFTSLISNKVSKPEEYFLAIQVDFEQPAQVELVIGKVIEKFGRLDILVNNAGYEGKKRSLSHPDFYEDYKRILQVNLNASVHLAQLASPHLIKTKGVLVNVSSVADRLAIPTISYSVSKAGLSMLTKALANALDGEGVRVVGVAPGPIVTNFAVGMDKAGPMTSLGRPGTSDEVANVIVFASSDKGSYIHGSTIDVDGGTYAKFGGIFKRFEEARFGDQASSGASTN